MRGSAPGLRRRCPPRPGQQRRLDRARHQVVRARRCCSGGPPAIERVRPEDRVADEAVGVGGVQQRLELAARAGRVEAAADDRVEARVPVPLPRIASAGWGPRRRSRGRGRRPRASWRRAAPGRRRRSNGDDAGALEGALDALALGHLQRATDHGPGLARVDHVVDHVVGRGDVHVDDLAEVLDQLGLLRRRVVGRLDLLAEDDPTMPSAPMTLISAVGHATIRSGS